MSGSVYYSSLATETNSFSCIPTDYESFELNGILRSTDIVYDSAGQVRPAMRSLVDWAEVRQLEVVAGISASAEPGLPIVHSDYSRLREELVESLKGAMPVKAVLLGLHGAMMSTQCSDCEGDILSHVRAVVGDDVPVAAVLDPHAHLTEKMVSKSDFLVFMKEYPHVDGLERMQDAFAVLDGLLDKSLQLEVAIENCRLLGFFPTDTDPMRSFVDDLYEVEQRDGVISVSFVHGFPWGDCEEVGAKVLVYSSGDYKLAESTAKSIADAVWEIKGDTMFDTIGVNEAVELALRNSKGTIVFGDIADNPGGGGGSDSTFILQAALENGLSDIAIGLMFDPDSVRMCHEAGVGARIELSIGGKLGEFSGVPVNVTAEVKALASQARMDVAGIVDFAMGDTAWIHVEGIDIVLSSVRIQMYSPNGFTHLGMQLESKKAVFVKSTHHFRAFFDELASEICYVNSPGAINYDLAEIPYEVFNKPYYPRL